MLKNLFSSRGWFTLKTIGFSVIVFFVAQFVALSLVYAYLNARGFGESEISLLLETNYTYTLIFSLLAAVFVVAGVVGILRLYKKKLLDYLQLKNNLSVRKVGEVLVVYVVYFMLLIVATIFVSNATQVDVNQQQELGFLPPRDLLSFVQVYIFIAILPPLVEEILFRGFLFGTLKKRLTIWWAAGITSVLFGLAHLEFDNLNWIAAIDTLLFSGFLIYLVQRHKSLYSAMLLHCIKNTIAFYVLFVHK